MKTKIETIMIVICLVFSINACALSKSNEHPKDDIGNLEVTMLDVGQGSGTLLASDGHYILVDGGGRASSDYVVAYLKEKKIEKLDAILVTHYDEDHVSGLMGVLHVFDVACCICPSYKSDTEIYKSFVKTLEATRTQIVKPSLNDQWTFGSAKLQVIGPDRWDHAIENDNSLCVKVICDDFSCIITGDAEAELEKEMLWFKNDLKATLYVVGHHGSSSSSSEAFLNAMKPAYAFISCGEGNVYGHPAKDTLDRLKKMKCQMYRSDKQGEVTAIYQNGKLTFTKEPCEDWTPGTVALPETGDRNLNYTAEDGMAYDYIGNAKTYVLHKPNCQSVGKMNEKNKVYMTCTRSEALARGFTPCGNCKP